MSVVGFRAVLGARGAIDFATADVLHGAMETIVQSGERDVWVDLTGATFVDGAGLQALLELRGALGRDHRRLIIIAPPGPALRTLQLAALDTAFEVYDARSSAHLAS